MGDLFQLGVNIGGTFTDTVLVGSDGSVRAKKCAVDPGTTTPSPSSTAHGTSWRRPASPER